MQKRKNPFSTRKINGRMRKKLVWLFGAVVLALVGLSVRITYINASEGNQYKKQVLSQSQQKYDSRVIPFKRGDIKDRNGAVLATSEKVYKVILDCKVVNYDEKYVEPTINAMVELLGLEEELVRDKLENEETRDSQYQIMKVNVPITEKKKFEDYLEITEEEEKTLTKEEKAEIQNVKGVWFEENYLRTYPMGATASHLVGFTYTGDTADWGIEGYYSSTLNGVNGRQYGYFNEDADVEQTIIEPVDGNSIISTIDVTIQQIVEKYIKELTDGLANGPNGEAGAKNVGVVVADPNTGQILAMATDQPFDLNDPRNLEPFYSEEEIQGMDEAAMLEALNGIWKNFCISDAFEPGSTVKPMTVAAALQDHSILPSATFVCDGRCLEIPESVVPFFQAPMESRLWRRLWQIPAMTP
ncbi:MAG: penicillin-binding transpeptidase domain-containing protein [Ruminococcus sp.]